MQIVTKKRNWRLHRSDIHSLLADSFFQLEQLLNAGVPIDVCLESLTDQEISRSLKVVWIDVFEKVCDGLSLSLAMQQWPTVFDANLVAIVNAGEASAGLARSCRECRQLIEWRLNLKKRFQDALTYPVFAFLVVSMAIGFLLVFLVPSLQSFIVSGGMQPAWHTNILLMFSEWLIQNVLALLAYVLVFFLLLVLGYQFSSIFRLKIDTLILKLPIIGRVISGLTLSRYCDNCSRLYGCGIPLESSMKMSESGVGNGHLKIRLKKARSEVRAGLNFSAAMNSSYEWPDMALRILRAGESSGSLKESLTHIGKQQWQSVDAQIGRLERLAGPVVLVSVALVLVWIVLSLLGPIYQSAIDSVVNL